MAEPTLHPRRSAAGGFTIIEMMVALSILVVGVTTLLAALGDSMSLRNSADARLAAAGAVEDLVHTVAATGLRRRDGGETDFDLELALPGEIEVPGYAGMRLSAKLEEDETRLDVFLLRIQARWFEQGQQIEEEFLRVLPRQLPLGMRIQRFRDEHDIKR